MFKRTLALAITTSAMADLAGPGVGDPELYFQSDVYGERWNAYVETAVYTEDDQQDFVGVPDNAILITYTLHNSPESQSSIEDFDIFTGVKSDELSVLSIPGYLTSPLEEQLDAFYNDPDYVNFAYETGLCNWDWGTEGNEESSGLKPGEFATMFVIAYADSWIESPGIIQGESDAGIFFTVVPEFAVIPSPGVLTMLGVSVIGRSRKRYT